LPTLAKLRRAVPLGICCCWRFAARDNFRSAMEAPGTVPASINCHSCSALIDLSGREGFTQVECPQCGELSVVPLQFGNFLLLSTLGTGGIGTVYKAIDLPLNRYLALKILRKKLAANPQFVEDFSHEARATASVNHPNVAQVYSFGEHEGQYYLAMELLGRGSLDDRLSQVGKLTEKEALDICEQIASALRAAQQRGLLHHDVKPGNILFNDDGVPKIVDFGLARAQTPSDESQEQQRPGPIWGTPYYVAPEKLRGQPEDLRSDIYSLGSTLFHALAGRPLLDVATTTDFAAKDVIQPASSLNVYAPQIHKATTDLICRMLAKNPSERYQTYDELIHHCKEAQAAVMGVAATPVVVTDSGNRLVMVSILTAIAALIGCGVFAWFLWTIRKKLFGE
jgi:serine/threonine protein kinase